MNVQVVPVRFPIMYTIVFPQWDKYIIDEIELGEPVGTSEDAICEAYGRLEFT